MKSKILIVIAAALLVLTGCGDDFEGVEKDLEQTEPERMESEDSRAQIEVSCRDIYVQSRENGELWSLETAAKMMDILGQEGFCAVHQDNQINMENPEQLQDFCEKAEEEQAGMLTLIMVLNGGTFVEFDLESESGDVNVEASNFVWKDGGLVLADADHYVAENWTYRGDGYLFFDRYYMEGFDGPYDHVAVRTEPLDSVLRDMNRKYILPLGYRQNNLFITDWDEDDFGEEDFCDLFDVMSRADGESLLWKHTDDLPEDAGGDGGDGGEYQIPADVFEKVIMERFSVSSQELQRRCAYLPDCDSYVYRPRGMYDSGMGIEAPWPEVIDCKSREDGTVELTVNAVWPEEHMTAAFTHKVVIRPMPEGDFQYVSNQVISFGENVSPIWYAKRLTDQDEN